MTNKFFANIRNQEELRKAYLQALKKHHPDNGGDAETCKAINAEYDRLMKILPEKGGAAAESAKTAEVSEAIRQVLEKIAGFQNINVEIVGSWIWIDGATFAIRDELKQIGFRWSSNRKKWHWAATGNGFHRGCSKKFDELRAVYGSMTVETGRVAFIA